MVITEAILPDMKSSVVKYSPKYPIDNKKYGYVVALTKTYLLTI